MNYKMICRFLSLVLLIEAGLLLIPMTVALIYGEDAMPFVYTVILLTAVSLPPRFFKVKNRRIYAKDGFVSVALSWIALSVFGALPFVFSGAIPNYIDALFESISGLTTTGATVIPLGGISSLPRGILFWRSFTHWIGGMGILVFMLAILPDTEGNTIYLMRAEVPGPQKGKLVPKLRQSSMILYGIYLALTVIEIIALLLTGMPLYDSLVNAFGTLGTGGFSVLDDSIAGYANPAAEWIISIFLLLSGVNYNIYFFLLIKKFGDIKKNEELKAYLAIVLASTAIITVNVWNSLKAVGGGALGKCIRDAFFQVTSIISTAGFTTVDLNALPHLSQTVILFLMFTGACAGSTAGGFKLSRLLIIIKSSRREIKKFFKPNSVKTISLDGNTLDEPTVKSSVSYLSVFILILGLSFALLSFEGRDMISTFTAALACFNNIGPGFGDAASTFADFSYYSKIILSLDMLFGRLEIVPMLVLFSKSTWSKG